MLRLFGTTPEVSQGPIFKQEQIARAIELGLGVKYLAQIHILPMTPRAKHLPRRLPMFCSRVDYGLLENTASSFSTR